MRKNAGLIFILILSALLVLAVCRPQHKELSGVERSAVLAYGEIIMDNLFAGLAANDYALFSRDFDAYMQKTLPAANFAAWKGDLDDNLGNFLSHQVVQAARSDEFYVVDYEVEFEREKRVMVTIAFHAAQPHSIGGLWFESGKLQGK